MKVIVAYDIACPRRIYRVSKILKDYGIRVQKSIFEVDVSTQSFKEMRRKIVNVIEPEEDGVKYFSLCDKCKHCLEIFGGGEFLADNPTHKII